MRQSQAFDLSYWPKYLRRKLATLRLGACGAGIWISMKASSLVYPLGRDQAAKGIAHPKPHMGQVVGVQDFLGAGDLGA